MIKNKFLGLIMAVVLCGSLDFVQAEEGVDEIETLKAFLVDKAQFEQKVHTFDKLHTAIARGLYAKASSLEKQGDKEAAYAAAQESERHINLVQSAYEMGLGHYDDSAILHNYYGEFIYDYLGDANKGAQHWKKAIQNDPNLARAHCNFGMYALHNGMYSIGFESMDTALRLEPDNPDYLYNMVQAYFAHSLYLMQERKMNRAKIFTEAMKMSKKAADILPEDFEILRDYGLNFFLGEEYGEKVNWKDAAKAWQKARTKARTDAERFNTWLNEARVYKNMEDSKKTLECLNAALEIWPDSPVVQELIKDLKR
jgi:tetratricopeptide (TPR) repeat protein